MSCVTLISKFARLGRQMRVSRRLMSGYSDDKQTHFGFQSVGEAEKREKVLEVFHNVADSYDMMNDVMSAGVHRLWKDYFVRKIRPGPGMRLLDVAGGTGDIAFRYLDSGGGSVVVCDINKSMLSVGEDRARERGFGPENISWVEGDAQVRRRLAHLLCEVD